MIIVTTPENYQDTRLYKLLIEKSNASDGLAEKTTCFVNTVRPLQELIISGPFRDYTLHNPNHSKKLLHIAEYIIHNDTINKLSALDLAIMIMSFYLHDLGMVLTQVERDRITQANDFQDYMQVKSEYGERIARIRQKIYSGMDEGERISLETSIFQITEAALADYLRPLHATKERYDQLIKMIKNNSGRNDLFSISGVSFENELIDVCISHNLNSSVLIETTGIHNERFQREMIINGFSVNLQYCGAILRLVDILDFDKERTPQSLFNALGIQNKSLPGFEISLKEWNKHLAVHTISINSDEVLISGDSSHPTIEHTIKEFCKIIEAEIKETQTILKQNKPEIFEKFKLNLPFIVRANIRSLNYIYKEYSIKLNETAIVNLLMGENLYSNSHSSIRELIQNAIDACDLRSKIETEKYIPCIKISTYKDADSRTWLKVIDNGIGMDEYVLSNFFFKVGNSYYSSPDFKRFSIKNQINDFVPISRFGIGLLSIFMIGESIKVTTCNLFSSRKDQKERTLLIDSVSSLAVVTEKNSGDHGTTIEVLLRNEKSDDNYLQKLFQYIRDTIIRPKIPIEYKDIDGNIINIVSDNYIKLNNKMKQILEESSIEIVQIDFERFSNLLKGKAIFFFFRNVDNTLSYYDKNEKIIWGNYPLKNSFLFENFTGGSRFTVNGIHMGLKRIGSLYSIKKRKTANVLDVEIIGIQNVTYNVSRQKVFGDGTNSVRKEIFKAVEEGFKEIGVYSKFDKETLKMLEKAYISKTMFEKLPNDLISKIDELLPPNLPYPENIHNEIAQKLNLNAHQVLKYVKAKPFLNKSTTLA